MTGSWYLGPAVKATCPTCGAPVETVEEETEMVETTRGGAHANVQDPYRTFMPGHTTTTLGPCGHTVSTIEVTVGAARDSVG